MTPWFIVIYFLKSSGIMQSLSIVVLVAGIGRLAGHEIAAGHRTMSGKNVSMSGRNCIWPVTMSGRKKLYYLTYSMDIYISHNSR